MKVKSISINLDTMDIFDTLTVVFLVLKLNDLIDWSWWWVFSPYFLETLLYIVIRIAQWKKKPETTQ